jgi:hypothetical protein
MLRGKKQTPIAFLNIANGGSALNREPRSSSGVERWFEYLQIILWEKAALQPIPHLRESLTAHHRRVNRQASSTKLYAADID